MSHDHDGACECSDYGLTRRRLLQGAAAAGAAGLVTRMFGDVLTSTAYGSTNGNVLVVVSLRGGCDGLSMVVPHAEQAYHAARPTTRLDPTRLLFRDDTFGLHPSFEPLSTAWTEKKVAAIHAVGMKAPNRSHFEAMEAIEDADPGTSARVGWINRMISGLAATPDLFDAMQIGSPILPTSLVGPASAIATGEFSDLVGPLTDRPVTRTTVLSLLSTEYALYGAVIGKAGAGAVALAGRAAAIDQVISAGAPSGVTYPKYSELGVALKTTAGLIRAGVGVKAVAVDAGGWDHHVDLSWRVSNSIKELAGCLKAFVEDLGVHADRVTIVTVSEFGRRLTENGSAGVDHGYGNVMLAMGAGVKGGQYYSRWPGLSLGNQVDGDLAVTTEYRSVLAEILRSRFPSVDVSKVFPGLDDRPLGFMA